MANCWSSRASDAGGRCRPCGGLPWSCLLRRYDRSGSERAVRSWRRASLSVPHARGAGGGSPPVARLGSGIASGTCRLSLCPFGAASVSKTADVSICGIGPLALGVVTSVMGVAWASDAGRARTSLDVCGLAGRSSFVRVCISYLEPWSRQRCGQPHPTGERASFRRSGRGANLNPYPTPIERGLGHDRTED
jgi:hypothetical protein